MSINNIEPTFTIDLEWNLELSHGLDSNYLVNGHAINFFVNHILLLKKYIKEFFPHIDIEANQAFSLGEPPEDHANACNNDCPDCLWYAWGLEFIKRKESGEFNEILS